MCSSTVRQWRVFTISINCALCRMLWNQVLSLTVSSVNVLGAFKASYQSNQNHWEKKLSKIFHAWNLRFWNQFQKYIRCSKKICSLFVLLYFFFNYQKNYELIVFDSFWSNGFSLVLIDLDTHIRYEYCRYNNRSEGSYLTATGLLPTYSMATFFYWVYLHWQGS